MPESDTGPCHPAQVHDQPVPSRIVLDHERHLHPLLQQPVLLVYAIPHRLLRRDHQRLHVHRAARLQGQPVPSRIVLDQEGHLRHLHQQPVLLYAISDGNLLGDHQRVHVLHVLHVRGWFLPNGSVYVQPPMPLCTFVEPCPLFIALRCSAFKSLLIERETRPHVVLDCTASSGTDTSDTVCEACSNFKCNMGMYRDGECGGDANG